MIEWYLFVCCIVYDWRRTVWLLIIAVLYGYRFLIYLGNGNILGHGLVKYYLIIYHGERLIQIIF